MSTLFEDAIADAKQLRVLAEENAKKKIIEAMSPRIRNLIEQELTGDLNDEELVDDIPMDNIDVVGVDELLPDEVPSLQHDINISVDGEANIVLSNGDAEIENEPDSEEEDLLMGLNQESARALASIICNPNKLGSHGSLYEELDIIRKKIRGFDKLLKYAYKGHKNPLLRESARKYCTRLLKEVISLRGDVILTEGTVSAATLRKKYNLVVKEMKTMSRRHAETLFDRLFEAGGKKSSKELDELDIVFDDEDLDMLGVEDTGDVDVTDLEIDVEMGGEEVEGEEEEEISDEVVESFLRRLREQEEIDVEEETEEEGPIEDVGEVIPVADAETALMDLGDALGLDVSVGAAEEEEEVEEETEEEVIEIDEGMLRRELRRMRRLREQEEAEDADPYLAHGGELIGDVELEVDEDDLINALADELGPPEVATPTVESRRRRQRSRRQQMAESRAPRTRRAPRRQTRHNINESRTNRALSGKLVEYKKAVGSLRGQLTEMNLFNAKLLYVNKLMQNRDLTSKQQRAIVEALDNAKTLREAKLLYKSLTASLNKRSGGRSLTEGRIARTLGSSSRSIRSASPAKSGNEVDRWAVLAGLNKDN